MDFQFPVLIAHEECNISKTSTFCQDGPKLTNEFKKM